MRTKWWAKLKNLSEIFWRRQKESRSWKIWIDPCNKGLRTICAMFEQFHLLSIIIHFPTISREVLILTLSMLIASMGMDIRYHDTPPFPRDGLIIWEWLSSAQGNEYVRTLPRGEMYWVVDPGRPRYFPREISRAEWNLYKYKYSIQLTINVRAISHIVSVEQKFWVSLRGVRQDLPRTFAKTQSPS